MKLIEALRVINDAARDGQPTESVHLLCGITPLHLQTYLTAYVQQRTPAKRVLCRTGIFGDLIGNLDRSLKESAGSTAVVVEWGDLDGRLGIRAAGSWDPSSYSDILQSVSSMLARVERAIQRVADRSLVAVSLPTLPLPPIAFTPTSQASSFELELRSLVATSASTLSQVRGVRLVGGQRLDAASPVDSRRDVAQDLAAGFPFSVAHASVLGQVLAELLAPVPPKKGLIVDLDDTLWRGIVGDVGPDGVSWSLEHHSQVHALLQQMVASLARAGVLIAVSSKNDSGPAEAALARPDMILHRSQIFPAVINWRAKSEAVAEILTVWNVGADSIVFVDDSRSELAQVRTRYPEVECLLFPKEDPGSVLNLLTRLRELFGKAELLQEDQFRLESIKAGAAVRDARPASADSIDEFLEQSEGLITVAFHRDTRNARAFELLNKTNQFNINGRRVTDPEWRALLTTEETFMATVAYQDKYGPLGTIAVVAGVTSHSTMTIQHWVMSCRAFARRIEHATLRVLFERFNVQELVIDYTQTDRNGPTRDFLSELFDMSASAAPLTLRRHTFDARCSPSHHRVEVSILEAAING